MSDVYDPFGETVEEYVVRRPVCTCGVTCQFDDDYAVDKWKSEHLECYAGQRKRDEQRAAIELKEFLAAAKRIAVPAQPGAITLQVVEACPFGHVVVKGVDYSESEYFTVSVHCNDCSAEGPAVSRTVRGLMESDKVALDQARLLWNSRRKI